MNKEEKRPCGIFPFLFGGWSRPACRMHDKEYEEMLKGKQTKTLQQVDTEFKDYLFELSERGRLQALKRLASAFMYSIAHVYGIFRWKGKLK